MTINTDLLIAAPMLQDYFVDKDTGFPLANGLVSLFKDNARSFYKNWYYQTGIPGAYTWVALDNPMHLSSVGTIQDPNGNDVIPFFYPYEENNENIVEKYYIKVYSTDENGDPSVLQFTRENFPFLSSDSTPASENFTLRNYILNNVYWRNVGALDAMDVTDSIIAPSQHEGYTNGDIRFIKNITGANDDIAFLPMTETLTNDVTPETYLNVMCTGVQLGETEKCIQYPISLHVKTLENQQSSFVIHAQNVAGNPNNFLDLMVYQYLGTGALSQPDPILIQRITLNSSFQKFVIPFIFPDAEGLTLGNGGDDALFLRVRYPLSAVFQINHTKPQIYLSTSVPTNDFDTYDQVETIINSPRTGDIRTSYNNFNPYGYVAMNDQTIGNASSGSTARANIDTWPLFNLIWNSLSFITNVITLFPIYDSAGVLTTYGANAIADFNANKRLSLPKALGRALIGSLSDGNGQFQGTSYSRSGDTLVMASTAQFFTGAPIVLLNSGGSPPSGLTVSTIYYAIWLSTTTLSLATTYANALAGTAITLSSSGSGINTIYTYLPGTTTGEFMHAQLGAEVGMHVHGIGVGTGVSTNTVGNNGNVNTGTQNTAQNNQTLPFNVVQPSAFYNMFIKL